MFASSTTGAQGLILTAGGNDVLGGPALEKMLLPYGVGKSPEDLLICAVADQASANAIDQSRALLVDIASAQPAIKVSCHLNGFDGRVQGTETFVHTRGRAVSRLLSRAVQAEMVAGFEQSDRNVSHGGVQVANDGVTRAESHHANTAAILHEGSVINVAAEARRLHRLLHPQSIAAERLVLRNGGARDDCANDRDEVAELAHGMGLDMQPSAVVPGGTWHWLSCRAKLYLTQSLVRNNVCVVGAAVAQFNFQVPTNDVMNEPSDQVPPSRNGRLRPERLFVSITSRNARGMSLRVRLGCPNGETPLKLPLHS